MIAPHGWWEQPAGGATVTPWTFHQGAFGRDGNAGANMEIYDVNGDKLPDVVTSLAAHGFGLAWYEQKRDAAGEISFVEHQIMGDFAAKNPGNVTFTELHALTMADVDGDGMKDIITGKRAWAHLDSYSDPDPHGGRRPLLVQDDPRSESARRRAVRARVDSQPVGRGLDDSSGRSEQGWRDRHHRRDQSRRAYLLGYSRARRAREELPRRRPERAGRK